MGRKPKNQINQTENQDQPIIEEENLVKKTCRELGITQKELAERIGVKPESLNSSLSRGNISLQIEKAVDLLLEVESLKIKLNDYSILKTAINNIIYKH